MNYRREEALTGVFVLVAFLGLVFGAILSIGGWREWTVYSKGSPLPQEVRLDELAKNGPVANVHVRVTDFALGEQYVVEEERGKWDRLWVPLFPARAPKDPRRIKVLVKTFGVTDERQLQQLYDKATLTGIIHEPNSLAAKELGELEKCYPGADFSSALVLECGSEFPSGTKVGTLFGVGAALLVTALMAVAGLFLIRRKARGKDFQFLDEPQ